MTTIKFSEGTSYRLEYILYDELNTEIDLNGAQLFFAGYTPGTAKLGTVAPVFYKTIGNGIDVYFERVNDVTKQRVLITFLPDETADKAGVYEWEMELVEINGDIWLAASGPLIIQPSRRLDR